LREHLQYSDDDILQILKNIKIPTLCITGEKDVQADPNDLIKVDSLGNKNITVKIIQNMDHILKYYSGEKTIMNLMKQYKNEVDEPLHEELKNSIQNWLDSKNQGQIV
jgi:pimeloyl-ACP methyl ester carboxylesterase